MTFSAIVAYDTSCEQQMDEAMTTNPDVDVLVNFASLRSAFDSTMETLDVEQVHLTIYIVTLIP